MCGLAGYLTISHEPDSAASLLERMGRAIQYRGPDASGVYVDEHIGLGFVHRRLAIQDLSPMGAQPMQSNSGRYLIVFNGEIYNFKRIADDLSGVGVKFRGHSDTEVILAAVEQYGLKEALNLFSGMFAFALWDKKERTLHLARDRMGEKPLFYGYQKGVLLFGSELKALGVHPAWEGKIDRRTLMTYVRHNFVPNDLCIFEGISKVDPGALVSIKYTDQGAPFSQTISKYWSASDFLVTDHQYDRQQAADTLERLLDEVVQEQMVSDVPLGAFLSGGVDSSTIVAIMQKHTSRPTKTFSIGFNEREFNEAIYAKHVAKHLKTDHTELYISPEDAMQIVPKLSNMYDEPFADSSQIPTHIVCRLAKDDVTVALSGDGGDELFLGYTRYGGTLNAWRNQSSLKNVMKKGLTSVPLELLSRFLTFLPPARGKSQQSIVDRLVAIRRLTRHTKLNRYYQDRISYWMEPGVLVKSELPEYDYAMSKELGFTLDQNSLSALGWIDLHCYLPDDILTKVDRAGMACSLETRIPLLDRRIVEYALGLPEAFKVSASSEKQVLRDVLYRHVPKELIERPKAGFAVPIAYWLRGPLRDWAESLLDSSLIKDQDYFESSAVSWLWNEHLSGREDYSFRLWGILMFQDWLVNARSVLD